MCFERFLKRVSLETATAASSAAFSTCRGVLVDHQEMVPPLQQKENVADRGQAGVRDVSEGSVCVAVDNAWQGVVDSVPLKRYFLTRLKVSQYLFRSGHVWLACFGHVSCEN